MIFSLGPRMRVDGERFDSFVAALYDRPALTEHDGVQHGLELKLSPPGARRLLGVPLDELHNATVPLEAVLGVRHAGRGAGRGAGLGRALRAASTPS